MADTMIAALARMLLTSFVLLLCSGSLRAEDAFVSVEDFAEIGGTQWQGVLRYLDYSSATLTQIPVEIMFDKPGRRSLVYRIKYPGEAQHNQKEKLKWSRDGRKLNGNQLVSRSAEPDGKLILQTRYQGEDDNRSAEIRMTYAIGTTSIAIIKEVQFADSEAFFERNAYMLELIPPEAARL